ncbi:MAG: GNAT family protein [bacterium]|nr:GNAT family protein [bacterium]
MITFRNLEEKDIPYILEWSPPSRAFLKQWSDFSYPLTAKQFIKRMESEHYCVVAIEQDYKLIGTIQLYCERKESRYATIGCYLLDPRIRGNGVGAEAIRKITDYAFRCFGFAKIGLGVYDYNISAIKCYRKAGFIKIGEYRHPFGWTGYRMERTNEIER